MSWVHGKDLIFRHTEEIYVSGTLKGFMFQAKLRDLCFKHTEGIYFRHIEGIDVLGTLK